MNGVLIDSCVLLDLFTDDPVWGDWAESVLERYSRTNTLYINPVIYAEVAVGFQRIEEVEAVVGGCGLRLIETPREALFLAGKAFLRYRRNRGARNSPLPDFFIGAQAAISELVLVTRDAVRYRTDFPTVELVYPEGN